MENPSSITNISTVFIVLWVSPKRGGSKTELFLGGSQQRWGLCSVLLTALSKSGSSPHLHLWFVPEDAQAGGFPLPFPTPTPISPHSFHWLFWPLSLRLMMLPLFTVQDANIFSFWTTDIRLPFCYFLPFSTPTLHTSWGSIWAAETTRMWIVIRGRRGTTGVGRGVSYTPFIVLGSSGLSNKSESTMFNL